MDSTFRISATILKLTICQQVGHSLHLGALQDFDTAEFGCLLWSDGSESFNLKNRLDRRQFPAIEIWMTLRSDYKSSEKNKLILNQIQTFQFISVWEAGIWKYENQNSSSWLFQHYFCFVFLSLKRSPPPLRNPEACSINHNGYINYRF